MDWKQMIVKNVRLSTNEQLQFQPSVTYSQIERAELTLQAHLPKPLYDLLSQSNGVKLLMQNPTTNEQMVYDSVYWSIDEIVSYTLEHYKYLSIIESQHTDKVIFFADNGCGEHFGYKVMDGNNQDDSIWVYYPIDNEYRKVANNLQEWITQWLSGLLST